MKQTREEKKVRKGERVKRKEDIKEVMFFFW